VTADRMVGSPSVRADLGRVGRTGEPEVVYAEGKSPEQTREAASALVAGRVRPVLVTRATAAHAAAVTGAHPTTSWHPETGLLVLDPLAPHPEVRLGDITIVTAGTSDLRVADECRLVLEAMGERPAMIADVGVAGLHRLLEVRPQLEAARVVVAVAGMEAALGPVVAGLVAAPVIAVPTSVGYGAAQHGMTALHGLLSACAPGIAVVNIDNGFGAAMVARRILQADGSTA
jgi:pyridinium-3,5-biscarboxylic acid mononucleotide synthase